MKIIIDTSVFLDLHKVQLLLIFLKLPYHVHIPDLLFYNELLSLNDDDRKQYELAGIKIVKISFDLLNRASKIQFDHPRLSFNDAVAFALFESIPDSILLTGDGELRLKAKTSKRRVHGAIWAFDEIHDRGETEKLTLQEAIKIWIEDTSVWLPEEDLNARQLRLLGGC